MTVILEKNHITSAESGCSECSTTFSECKINKTQSARVVWRKDCASSESKFVCPSKTELRALVAQRAVIFLGRKQRRLSWWSTGASERCIKRGSAKRSSDFCGCHNNWKKILPPPQGASRWDECWILSSAAAYRPHIAKRRSGAHSTTFWPRQLNSSRSL